MVAYLILVGDDGTIDPDDQRAADKVSVSVDYNFRMQTHALKDCEQVRFIRTRRLEGHLPS